ncbi:hypothetical protein GIB67_032631 [Kingdonia uniflora]|uniref:Pentatricopeptide repeat-containing protein n=1 Tax=Kingdonia uniflora TaxID=39325 RepID=A0A7J7P9Z7_9MAGN|nr:hypothetical protein GIB67_032631 [Kingdonia uniflora]
MYSSFDDNISARKLFDTTPVNVLDIVSWNTLIDGCVKSGDLDLAREIFDRMPERNDVSWTAMISGYAKSGELDVAQSLFDKMMPVCRNVMTWNSMISGFAKSGFLSLARKMFDDMPCKNIVSWNIMVSGYAQCGELEVARCLFDDMEVKDVFSWSCMIAGYAQNNRGEDGLNLFREMLAEDCIRPNEVTLVSVLSVCGHLVALDQGKWIHSYIDRNGCKVSGNLGAALIDMYAKCGCVENAVEVFQKMNDKNISTWNALITGFAVNGVADGAIEAFSQMQKLEMKPNSITFLGVLMACCHGGLVEEGRRYFEIMSKTYEIQPEMKHYGCIIDLLGRAGLLEEAEAIVKTMTVKPDVMVLGALFGACRIHGETLIADRLRKDFLRMKSREAGCHILLSNIYAAAGRWADACSTRSMLTMHEIKKGVGLSSVELPKI